MAIELLIKGKPRKIVYNKKDNIYYYNSKEGKVDASKYFLKGDKVSYGILKKQYTKILVGGGNNSFNETKETKETEEEEEEKEKKNRLLSLRGENSENIENIENSNSNDNDKENCLKSINDVLNTFFDENTDENTGKKSATKTVNEINQLINNSLCNKYYDNNWKWKKKTGGKPPKKDLKTFLYKLHILIKEFE